MRAEGARGAAEAEQELVVEPSFERIVRLKYLASVSIEIEASVDVIAGAMSRG